MWEAGGGIPAPGHEGNRSTEEGSPYLQHFVPREAKFLEQQADISEIHAHKGVTLWLVLHCPAHWE